MYRIQKDLMDEIKRKELSSSPLASRSFLPEDAWKWQSPGLLSNCGRQSISGSEASCSPMKSLLGHNSPQTSPFHLQKQDGCSSKVHEQLESRPLKVRRRMFDLTLPAENYVDTEESEIFKGKTYHQEDKAVADLNQPIHIEDTNVPIQPRAQTLCDRKILSKDLSSKSECGSNDGILSNRHAENNASERGWFSHAIIAGNFICQ